MKKNFVLDTNVILHDYSCIDHFEDNDIYLPITVLEELDRFVTAMRSIRGEIDEIIAGRIAVEDSALRRSPHTLDQVASDDWDRPYSRRRAAFPEPSLVRDKYFPPVSRIDNAWGDRHLTCICPAPEDVEAATGPLRSTATGSTARPTAVLTAEEK